MKRLNISKSTVIIALMLTASLILSGCTEGSAETVGGGENNTEAVTETNAPETAGTEATTPAVTVTADTTEPVTSAAGTLTATETAKATENKTEAPVSVTATSTAPVAAWAETAANGTMYINTNGIYSRKEAVQGSAKVKQYGLNEAVTVTAKTNTGYYKLSGGAFIHMDYLSANKVTVTTTTTVKPVVTTTSTQSKPSQDRSYLNLSNSDVQYILNECQKYAISLGYRVQSRADYEAECDELNKKCRQLRKEGVSEAEIDKIWDEFEATLRYFTNVNDNDFWSSCWHYIMYAGDFKKKYENNFQFYGYDEHCDTKEQSIEWVIKYLKSWIKFEHDEGRSCSTAGTKLKTFDNIAKEKGDWGVVSYDDMRNEYATGNFTYDINTSYAFSVKFY